jgi:hypothetical protein
MNIAPDVHLIESIRALRGSYVALLAEGVDNAFDAGARTIMAQLTPTYVSLEDDGCGITVDRQSAIVQFGGHVPMRTTALGIFGVGIKYQAVAAGDVLEVSSTSVDGQLTLQADWSALVKRRDRQWEISDPLWTPRYPGAATRTQVVVRKLRWPAAAPAEIEKIINRLAFLFYPALADGRAILVNGTAIPVLPEPALEHVIEGLVELGGGKGARVRAGLLSDRGAPLYQVQVSYQHRIILSRSTFGCGSYGGLRRLFARVVLLGEWRLTQFKDGLVDADADELETRIEELLRPLLERCHAAQMSAVVDEVTLRLNAMLPPEMVAVRPPRKRGQRPNQPQDKRKPKAPGACDVGTATPRGPARARRMPTNQVIIEFVDPLVAEYGYGRFIPGRPGRIELARDNPDITALLALRDCDLRDRLLYGIALMLYQHGLETEPGYERDLFDERPFGLAVWKLAQRQEAADGATAGDAAG